MRFAGKAALITGAASGMGLLTAQKLAEEGACAYMADIDGQRAEELAREIREKGGKAVAVPCDVRSYEQVNRAVRSCIEGSGCVDILVNFAGGFPARMCKLPPEQMDFLHTPVEVLDWGVEVNFRAPLYFARAAMGYMLEKRSGVIVNIGSIDGETGGAVDYAAEKSGLTHGLTKALARVGAPYGVRCCGVTPGPVLTRPGMAAMKTALGRAAEPIEVVKLVLYLCSEDAAFITGSNFLIDGGRALLSNC